MANTGRFCASLEQPKALMKMGLSMVLVGHVNFLLGALVHGAVLRHINLNTRAHTMAYSISNIMALTTGLVGVVVGMLAILLCKNKKSRVRSMTLILWVPLIVICIVQLVLSVRCFSVCVSFLGLPCFPRKIRLRDHGRTINAVAPAEPPSLTSSVPGHPLHIHLLQSDPPHLKSQRQPLPPPPLHHSCPSHLKSQRQLLPPPPPLHHSNPSHLKSQRQPLRPQHQNQRGSSDRWSDGGQLVPPEEHELLEQGFWI
ncbi:transmembrane protein 54 isoform X3 [Oncorhynchus kisutch]|uniref:transmembrane protein 54 isoform X3 n=1 Tax=Oncorhynchus kisutch TaxID=8019 RepID=UPI0012DF9053|nr:transmembrane protein 54 isoform X3 [Oncorhynchus kisutch]